MSDNETLKVYAEQADTYAQMTSDANQADPILGAFLQAIPKGAQLLDLGCGPGDSAAVMSAHGHNVTATDAVPEMVELAKKHAGVTAHVANFDDITGTDVYDGIWANFSLLHAPKIDMPRHLAAISQALKPQGVFHIAMKTGSGEHRDKIGRNYSYYTQSELAALLEEAGLKVKNSFSGEGTGLDGTIAQWVCLHAYG